MVSPYCQSAPFFSSRELLMPPDLVLKHFIYAHFPLSLLFGCLNQSCTLYFRSLFGCLNQSCSLYFRSRSPFSSSKVGIQQTAFAVNLLDISWSVDCVARAVEYSERGSGIKLSFWLLFCAFCGSFTRKLLVAVVDKWDSHVLVIDKVSPPNWKVWIRALTEWNAWFSSLLLALFLSFNTFFFSVTTSQVVFFLCAWRLIPCFLIWLLLNSHVK